MNVASLELCKELYELSGWKPDQRLCWADNATVAHAQEGYPKLTDKINLTTWKFNKQYGLFIMYPAYDLGYLLRKLPPNSWVGKSIEDWEYPYSGHTGPEDDNTVGADTPEDAACKLAIDLFKQGILK